MTTYYNLGDTVTLEYDVLASATVTLNVTAPDGTESTPAVSFVVDTWTATVTANQYETWQYVWRATGTVTDVTLGSFYVGAPLYATLATLKSNLNILATDTTRDSDLRHKLDSASRSVEEYCDNRRFYLDSTATARVYSTIGRTVCRRDGTQLLKVDDIGSISGLLVEVGDGTTWTTITLYDTSPDNALVKRDAITGLSVRSGEWGANRRARITAVWGWPTVPTAVYEATLLQASRLYRRKDSPEGVAGSSEWGLVRVPNLDPDVKALLAHLSSQWQAA